MKGSVVLSIVTRKEYLVLTRLESGISLRDGNGCLSSGGRVQVSVQGCGVQELSLAISQLLADVDVVMRSDTPGAVRSGVVVGTTAAQQGGAELHVVSGVHQAVGAVDSAVGGPSDGNLAIATESEFPDEFHTAGGSSVGLARMTSNESWLSPVLNCDLTRGSVWVSNLRQDDRSKDSVCDES